MNFSRTTIGLYLALIFASGATLGWFGNRYYAAREAAETAGQTKAKYRRSFNQDEFRKQYLAGMKKQLLLSDEQVQKLSGVLDETRSLMNELQKRQLPEQFEIQNAQQAKIRAIFDDIQREKYDQMLERMRQNSKNKNKTPAEAPHQQDKH